MKQRIEKGIYYDDRCANNPWYVQIMVRGIKYYKKFKDFEGAENYKREVQKRSAIVPTDYHDFIFEQDGSLLLDCSFFKRYPKDEDGIARAIKIATILEKLMDEEA